MKGRGDISKLPEECLSHIISFTSPRDTRRSSTVSKFFRSAADADGLWNHFLPEDYTDILKRASSPVGLFPSKKDLFFYLCDQPILIDQGKKIKRLKSCVLFLGESLLNRRCHDYYQHYSDTQIGKFLKKMGVKDSKLLHLSQNKVNNSTISFTLEKSSGKKRYMLSSKELSIKEGNLQYSRLTSLTESRFLDGTKISGWWLDIKGNLNSVDLSPTTTYAVYFIYKLNPRSTSRTPIDCKYQEASVLLGTQLKKEVVMLESHATSCTSSSTTKTNWCHGNLNHMLYYQAQIEHPKEVRYFPKERVDGWMEIFMGDFCNEDVSDGDVEMSLLDIDGGLGKSDVIVEGIELRPK